MPPGDRVVEALRLYSEASHDILLAFSRWLGVRHGDARAFSEVAYAAERGEPLTPAALARRVGLTSGATTSLLDRLEAAELVVRSREHADRRLVTLRPSPTRGRRAAEFFDPVADRVDALMAHHPPAFLESVETLLGELHEALTRVRADLDEATDA